LSLLTEAEQAIEDDVDVPADVAWKLLRLMFNGQPTQTKSIETNTTKEDTNA